MKLRSVLLVIFATVVGVVRFPSLVRADNYSLEAVPLYQPWHLGSFLGYDSSVLDAVVTSSLEEKIALETQGWKTNTICYVSPAQIPGTIPLMRLFNPASGDHLCTTSVNEGQTAIAEGFTSEGILGYVFPKEAKAPGTVPLHRFYVPFYQSETHGDYNPFHAYSTDEHASSSYRDPLTYEGIACYVWPAPTQIATLTITAPRPGNTLRGGSDYEVCWSASSKIGAVSIGYSSDAGYSWMVTDCGLANKGFATWRVPNIDTNHARMQIVWTDAASGPTNVLATAESGADLSIKRTPFAPLHARTLQAVAVRAKPTGLNARRFSASEIRLSWQAAKGSPKGYLVERRTGQGPFRQVANVLAPGVTHADGYISPGTSYAYRVRAYWGGASSGYSDVASVKTASSLGAAGRS